MGRHLFGPLQWGFLIWSFRWEAHFYIARTNRMLPLFIYSRWVWAVYIFQMCEGLYVCVSLYQSVCPTRRGEEPRAELCTTGRTRLRPLYSMEQVHSITHAHAHTHTHGLHVSRYHSGYRILSDGVLVTFWCVIIVIVSLPGTTFPSS